MIIRTLLVLALISGIALASPGEHLQPGQTLPPLSAKDQNGKTVTLEEPLGPQGTIFVIFRSADW